MEFLTSPLRRYIRQILESNLSKYISHINLEALGLGDVVLSNLELKLDAIQDLLSIPLAFVVSLGNVKDLRIHIPWTHLLSQPIEIRLANVEIVLVARNELDYRKLQLEYTKRKIQKSGERNENNEELPTSTGLTNQSIQGLEQDGNIDNASSIGNVQQDNKRKQQQNDQQGGEIEISWLQSTLRKVLGNATVTIENLVLKYEHDNVVLSTSIESINVYSANPNENWTKGFQEPLGIFQVLGKCVSVNGLTVNLERVSPFTALPSTPATAPTPTSKSQSRTRHKSITFEVPILKRAVISSRICIHLDPFASSSVDLLYLIMSDNDFINEEENNDDDSDDENDTQTQYEMTNMQNPLLSPRSARAKGLLANAFERVTSITKMPSLDMEEESENVASSSSSVKKEDRTESAKAGKSKKAKMSKRLYLSHMFDPYAIGKKAGVEIIPWYIKWISDRKGNWNKERVNLEQCWKSHPFMLIVADIHIRDLSLSISDEQFIMLGDLMVLPDAPNQNNENMNSNQQLATDRLLSTSQQQNADKKIKADNNNPKSNQSQSESKSWVSWAYDAVLGEDEEESAEIAAAKKRRLQTLRRAEKYKINISVFAFKIDHFSLDLLMHSRHVDAIGQHGVSPYHSQSAMQNPSSHHSESGNSSVEEQISQPHMIGNDVSSPSPANFSANAKIKRGFHPLYIPTPSPRNDVILLPQQQKGYHHESADKSPTSAFTPISSLPTVRSRKRLTKVLSISISDISCEARVSEKNSKLNDKTENDKSQLTSDISTKQSNEDRTGLELYFDIAEIQVERYDEKITSISSTSTDDSHRGSSPTSGSIQENNESERNKFISKDADGKSLEPGLIILTMKGSKRSGKDKLHGIHHPRSVWSLFNASGNQNATSEQEDDDVNNNNSSNKIPEETQIDDRLEHRAVRSHIRIPFASIKETESGKQNVSATKKIPVSLDLAFGSTSLFVDDVFFDGLSLFLGISKPKFNADAPKKYFQEPINASETMSSLKEIAAEYSKLMKTKVPAQPPPFEMLFTLNSVALSMISNKSGNNCSASSLEFHQMRARFGKDLHICHSISNRDKEIGKYQGVSSTMLFPFDEAIDKLRNKKEEDVSHVVPLKKRQMQNHKMHQSYSGSMYIGLISLALANGTIQKQDDDKMQEKPKEVVIKNNISLLSLSQLAVFTDSLLLSSNRSNSPRNNQNPLAFADFSIRLQEAFVGANVVQVHNFLQNFLCLDPLRSSIPLLRGFLEDLLQLSKNSMNGLSFSVGNEQQLMALRLTINDISATGKLRMMDSISSSITNEMHQIDNVACVSFHVASVACKMAGGQSSNVFLAGMRQDNGSIEDFVSGSVTLMNISQVFDQIKMKIRGEATENKNSIWKSDIRSHPLPSISVNIRSSKAYFDWEAFIALQQWKFALTEEFGSLLYHKSQGRVTAIDSSSHSRVDSFMSSDDSLHSASQKLIDDVIAYLNDSRLDIRFNVRVESSKVVVIPGKLELNTPRILIANEPKKLVKNMFGSSMAVASLADSNEESAESFLKMNILIEAGQVLLYSKHEPSTQILGSLSINISSNVVFKPILCFTNTVQINPVIVVINEQFIDALTQIKFPVQSSSSSTSTPLKNGPTRSRSTSKFLTNIEWLFQFRLLSEGINITLLLPHPKKVGGLLHDSDQARDRSTGDVYYSLFQLPRAVFCNIGNSNLSLDIRSADTVYDVIDILKSIKIKLHGSIEKVQIYQDNNSLDELFDSPLIRSPLFLLGSQGSDNDSQNEAVMFDISDNRFFLSIAEMDLISNASTLVAIAMLVQPIVSLYHSAISPTKLDRSSSAKSISEASEIKIPEKDIQIIIPRIRLFLPCSHNSMIYGSKWAVLDIQNNLSIRFQTKQSNNNDNGDYNMNLSLGEWHFGLLTVDISHNATRNGLSEEFISTWIFKGVNKSCFQSSPVLLQPIHFECNCSSSTIGNRVTDSSIDVKLRAVSISPTVSSDPFDIFLERKVLSQIMCGLLSFDLNLSDLYYALPSLFLSSSVVSAAPFSDMVQDPGHLLLQRSLSAATTNSQDQLSSMDTGNDNYTRLPLVTFDIDIPSIRLRFSENLQPSSPSLIDIRITSSRIESQVYANGYATGTLKTLKYEVLSSIHESNNVTVKDDIRPLVKPIKGYEDYGFSILLTFREHLLDRKVESLYSVEMSPVAFCIDSDIALSFINFLTSDLLTILPHGKQKSVKRMKKIYRSNQIAPSVTVVKNFEKIKRISTMKVVIHGVEVSVVPHRLPGSETCPAIRIKSNDIFISTVHGVLLGNNDRTFNEIDMTIIDPGCALSLSFDCSLTSMEKFANQISVLLENEILCRTSNVRLTGTSQHSSSVVSQQIDIPDIIAFLSKEHILSLTRVAKPYIEAVDYVKDLQKNAKKKTTDSLLSLSDDHNAEKESIQIFSSSWLNRYVKSQDSLSSSTTFEKILDRVLKPNAKQIVFTDEVHRDQPPLGSIYGNISKPKEFEVDDSQRFEKESLALNVQRITTCRFGDLLHNEDGGESMDTGDTDWVAVYWRYPEPRIVTEIVMDPVSLPFSLAAKAFGANARTIRCQILYWDTIRDNTVILAEFHAPIEPHDLTSIGKAVDQGDVGFATAFAGWVDQSVSNSSTPSHGKHISIDMKSLDIDSVGRGIFSSVQSNQTKAKGSSKTGLHYQSSAVRVKIECEIERLEAAETWMLRWEIPKGSDLSYSHESDIKDVNSPTRHQRLAISNVLSSALCVHSEFRPIFIPSTEFKLSITSFKISLMHYCGSIHQKLTRSRSPMTELIQLNIDSFKIHMQKFPKRPSLLYNDGLSKITNRKGSESRLSKPKRKMGEKVVVLVQGQVSLFVQDPRTFIQTNILLPCYAMIDVCKNPNGHQDIDLRADKLFFNMSPSTVGIFHHVVSTFADDDLQQAIKSLDMKSKKDKTATTEIKEDIEPTSILNSAYTAPCACLRYIFVNHTGRCLYFGQDESTESILLKSDESIAYSWLICGCKPKDSALDAKRKKRVHFALTFSEHQRLFSWSTPVCIDNVGVHKRVVKAQYESPTNTSDIDPYGFLQIGDECVLWVSIQQGDNGHQLIVRLHADIAIVNKTMHPIEIGTRRNDAILVPSNPLILSERRKANQNTNDAEMISPLIPKDDKNQIERPKSRSSTPIIDIDQPVGYLSSNVHDNKLSSSFDGQFKDMLNIMLPLVRNNDHLANCLVFRQSLISQWSQRLLLSNSDQGTKSLLEIPGRIGTSSIWLWYTVQNVSLFGLPSRKRTQESNPSDSISKDDLSLLHHQVPFAWKVVELEPPLWIENRTQIPLKCIIRPEYRWESLQYALNAASETEDDIQQESQQNMHVWPSLSKLKYIEQEKNENEDNNEPYQRSDDKDEKDSPFTYFIEPNSRASINIDPREAHAFQAKLIDPKHAHSSWSLPPLRVHYQMFESVGLNKDWTAIGIADIEVNSKWEEHKRLSGMNESLIAKIGANIEASNTPSLEIVIQSTTTFENETNDIIWVMPVDIQQRSKNITWKQDKPVMITGSQSIQTFWSSRADPVNNSTHPGDDLLDAEIDQPSANESEILGVIFAITPAGKDSHYAGATSLLWSEPIPLDINHKSVLSIPVVFVGDLPEANIEQNKISKLEGTWVKRTLVDVAIDDCSSIYVKIKEKCIVENNTNLDLALRSVPPNIFKNRYDSLPCVEHIMSSKMCYSPLSFKMETLSQMDLDDHDHIHSQSLEAFSTMVDIAINNETMQQTTQISWRSPAFEIPENNSILSMSQKPLCYYIPIPDSTHYYSDDCDYNNMNLNDIASRYEVKRGGALVSVLVTERDGTVLVSINSVMQPQMILRNETDIPLRMSMPTQLAEVSSATVVELKPWSALPLDQRIFNDIVFRGLPESIQTFGERYSIMKRYQQSLGDKSTAASLSTDQRLDDRIDDESSIKGNEKNDGNQNSWFGFSLISNMFSSNRSSTLSSERTKARSSNDSDSEQSIIPTVFSRSLKEQRKSPSSVYEEDSQHIIRFRLHMGDQRTMQKDNSPVIITRNDDSLWCKDVAIAPGSTYRVNIQTNDDVGTMYAGEITMERVTGTNIITIRERNSKSPRPSSPRPLFAFTPLTSRSPRPGDMIESEYEGLDEYYSKSEMRMGLNLLFKLRVQIEFVEVSFSEDVATLRNEKPLSNLLHLRLFGTRIRNQVETSDNFKTISNECGDYGIKRTRTMTGVRFVSAQIDTHSPETESPLVLSFLPSRDQRCLSFTIAIIEPDLKNNLPAIYEIISIQASPFLVNIEDILLKRAIQTILPLVASLVANSQLKKKSKMISSSSLLERSKKYPFPRPSLPFLFIEKFDIESLQLMITLKTLTLPVFLGLDKTWLSFSPVHLSNVFCSEDVLGKEMLAIFIADAILRVPALLGSLEILGNPTGFFRSINDGLYDLFAIPLHRLQQGWGPGLLIRSLAQGWTSLFFHVSEGFLHSLSGFSGSVSRNLDRLSMDPEYMELREQLRRQAKRSSNFESFQMNGHDSNEEETLGLTSPRAKATPFTTGVRGLTTGLWGGATGVVTMPMKSAIEDGISTTSIIKGVGKGLVGVIVKPLGGAAELVAQTSEGILMKAGSSAKADGQEFPQVFTLPETKTNLNLLLEWKYLDLLESCLMAAIVTLEIADASIGFRKAMVRVLITDYGIRTLPYCPVYGLNIISDGVGDAQEVADLDYAHDHGKSENHQQQQEPSMQLDMNQLDGHYRSSVNLDDMFFIPWRNFIKFEESIVQTNLLILIARKEIHHPNSSIILSASELDTPVKEVDHHRSKSFNDAIKVTDDITVHRLKFDKAINRREFGMRLLGAKRMFEQKSSE